MDKEDADIGKFKNTEGAFVNYTKVKEVTKQRFNLAPRKQFCGVEIAGDRPRSTAMDSDGWEITEDGTMRRKMPSRWQVYSGGRAGRAYPMQGCLMLFDTDRERDIGLGVRYPFKALEEGECVIHERMATALRLKVGDIFYVKVDMY